MLNQNRKKQILITLSLVAIFCIRYYFVLPPLEIESDKYVGQNISFIGKIILEPDKRDDFTRYVVDPEEFEGYKILITANRFPEFEYGDVVEINGKLEFPKNFQSDLGKEFDYKNYLAKDGIRYVSFRPEMELIGSDKGSKFFLLLYTFKNKFVGNVEASIVEPHSSLANGITLGLKQSLGKELLDNFRTSGIIHIVVLSGYNMTIILTGVMYLLGRFQRIPRGTALALGAIVMIGFAALVGFSATVLRATLMALLAILARFLGRPVLALRTLFITAFIMILFNPLILFYDPSFQLSFLATFGLITFSPLVEKKIRMKKSIMKEIMVATIATQIFVLPALIYMTGQFSLVSLPVNLLILPLVPWTMAFTGIVGMLGFFPDLILKTLAFPAYLLLEFIIKISDIATKIPLSSITISSIPLWVVFAWYAIYLWLLRSFSPQLPNSS